MSNNQALIGSCRKTISGEDEPHSTEWLDMVEALCDALEKTDNQLRCAFQALHNVGARCSAQDE